MGRPHAPRAASQEALRTDDQARAPAPDSRGTATAEPLRVGATGAIRGASGRGDLRALRHRRARYDRNVDRGNREQNSERGGGRAPAATLTVATGGWLSCAALVRIELSGIQCEVSAQRDVRSSVLRVAAPALEVFAILERALRTCEPRMPTRRATQSLCSMPSRHGGGFCKHRATATQPRGAGRCRHGGRNALGNGPFCRFHGPSSRFQMRP